MPRALLAVLAVAGVLAGCGDDEPAPTSEATPGPTAAATETPTPTATETPSPTATEQPSPAPEEQEGGAGDEEEARVPVRFVVSDGGVMPREVGVPGFLAIELVIRNETSEPVVARLQGEEPLTVDPGETTRARLEGRRPGRYPIDFGAAGEAVVETGVEPGP
ncbi:MAG TPA: hypothetical protein VNO82_17120 [Solirubrobacteraceae bacterium]|nr:hypothetical protein [Solirubrobacteraceae bacterium]